MNAETDSGAPEQEVDEYLRSLRPADDLVELEDDSELRVLNSLIQSEDDPDATIKLPVIDIDSLPAEVRDNLGNVDGEGETMHGIAAA